MSSNERKVSSTDRRGFLRSVVVAGSGAVVGLSAAGSVASAASEDTEQERSPVAAGYHETQHVLDYYRTVSF